MSNETLLLRSSHMFMNGVEEDCPTNCLSIFSFVGSLFAVSTANHKSANGKGTQYNLLGRVFLKISNICGSL